jgi:hypothetical protein
MGESDRCGENDVNIFTRHFSSTIFFPFALYILLIKDAVRILIHFSQPKYLVWTLASKKSIAVNRIDLPFLVPELESSDLKKRFIGTGYPVATNKPKE